MRASLWAAVLLVGCGARVEEAGSVADSGATEHAETAVGPTDIGSAFAGGDTGTPPKPSDAGDPPPDASPPEDVPAFVDLEVCESEAGVDKLVFDMSEPMAPLPVPSPITVPKVGGTSCSEAFDGSSSTGEYAYGATCGPIDRTQAIVVVVDKGVKSQSGKTLPPGIYRFEPTGETGHICGEVFRI